MDVLRRPSWVGLCATLALVFIAIEATAGTPDTTSKRSNEPRCAGKQAGVSTPDQLVGDWTGDNGERVQIAPAVPNDIRNFLFKAQHEWKGIYDKGTLTFRRTPTAAEMSPVAPIWARLAVVGKIEWKLVLASRHDCGDLVLEGDWFPGELKFKEVDTPQGKVASETASVIGVGVPIHLVFRKSAPSHLFLYAVTAHGLQSIGALYPGVATIVELQFDSPPVAKEWPVSVEVASSKLALVARQKDVMGHIFRTDAFVPQSGAVPKDQAFNPPAVGGKR